MKVLGQTENDVAIVVVEGVGELADDAKDTGDVDIVEGESSSCLIGGPSNFSSTVFCGLEFILSLVLVMPTCLPNWLQLVKANGGFTWPLIESSLSNIGSAAIFFSMLGSLVI